VFAILASGLEDVKGKIALVRLPFRLAKKAVI